MTNEAQHRIKILFLSLCLLTGGIAFGQDTPQRRTDTILVQQDTLPAGTDTAKRMIPVDSLPKIATPLSNADRIDSIMRRHSPKKAALRSAILPGWGQIYNRKYWKLPIVYGALGVSGAVFVYNVSNYRDLRVAYRAKYNASLPPPQRDSSEWNKIRPDLLRIDPNSLRSLRDEFRRNVDYSVLVFVLLWGLNVVDATVDAHLKPFDVSPDLSLKFKLGPSEMARTNGVSLVLAFK